MKKEIKVWLEPEDIKRLKQKAEEMGFEGKGATSHYIQKICREPIVFIPKDIRVAFELKE